MRNYRARRLLAALAAFVIVTCLLVSCALQVISASAAAPEQAQMGTATLAEVTKPAAATATPEKPTPTPTAQPTIDATPTPWVVIMIMVTPTPHKLPPSLEIKNLAARMKGQAPTIKAFAMPALLDMPPEVGEAIDLFWDWTVQRQAEYFAITGKYCQMLPSHLAAIPGDGDHLYPDGWYAHPTDQQYSWQNLNAVQYEPLPFAITIDVYRGPEGPGYVACFSMGVSGKPYSLCRTYGPEAGRDHDWQVVEAGE